MTCCFIGHRRIKHKKELASRLRDNICYLLEQGVATFLFGDHSEFNTLCYKVVSELREVYPQIRRIHYRTDYPDADAYTMQFLLDGYEDSICPDGVAAAGKAAYVERNQAMIQASDFCVFYFNNEYLPASRKESKKAITSYQTKSGTGIAFDYAKAHGRTIINLESYYQRFEAVIPKNRPQQARQMWAQASFASMGGVFRKGHHLDEMRCLICYFAWRRCLC